MIAACTAHAAIIEGPEHEVSPRVFGHAFEREQIRATASDGTDYLVAWSSDYPAAQALNITIVGADGAPRTIPSHTVRQKPVNEAFAVWTGDVYFVAWIEQSPFAIYFVRVARDGTPQSTPTFLAEATELNGVVFNGRTVLVAYQATTVAGISLALLDDRGRFLRDLQLPAPNIIHVENVAANNAAGRFVIAWAENGPLPNTPTRISATTIDDAGNIAPPVIVAKDIEEIAVQTTMAEDGSRVDLALVTSNTSTLLRYAIDATTLSVESFPPMRITFGSRVALVSSKQVLACWTTFRDGTRLLESIPFAGGTLHEMPIGSAFGFVLGVNVASNGSSLLAAWSVDDNFHVQAQGVLLSADAMVKQTDATVTVSAPAQRLVSMSAARNTALVVWIEVTGTDRGDVVAARVDSHGVPLGAPFVIASNVAKAAPTAGFAGGSWLVAYAPAPNANYVVRRVSLSGNFLDFVPQDLGFASSVFASNGKTSVFAGTLPSGSVAERRFNADGIAIDASPIVLADRTAASWVSASASSDQFFVAWSQDVILYPAANGNVFGVRLDANGAPIDAAPIAVANSENNERNPCVASDGRDFMIGVVTLGSGTLDTALRAKKLLHEGALSGVTSGDFGKVAGNHAAQCAIVYTSGRYHLAFVNFSSSDRVPIAASSIDDDGNLIELSGLVATTISDQAPVLVDVDGTRLTAYSRVPEDLAVPRVVVRTLSNELLPKSRGARH
jgi:hypothetical protein